MTDLQVRAGRVVLLTRDTAVATGDIGYLQGVLDAAERSGLLVSHDGLTPVAGESGVYLVNVRLRPRRVASQQLGRAEVSRAIAVRPAPGLARPVQPDRRTALLATATIGVPVVGGAVVWAAVEVWDEIVHHLALIIGGLTFAGVVVLVVARLIGGDRGCEGVHIRH